MPQDLKERKKTEVKKTKHESLSLLNQFRWEESYISLILGVVVVIVVVGVVISLARARRVGQTSSVQYKQQSQEQKVDKKQEKESTSETYVVKPGDDLWNIAVKAYGDGYRWVDVAKANKLENPNILFKDTVLKIPR